MLKKLITTKKFHIMILLAAMLCILLLYFTLEERKALVTPTADASEVILSLSDTSSFHSEDFEIEILTSSQFHPSDMAIHYTLDGSTPTMDSPVYTEPLHFSVTDEVQVQVLKAAVSYKNQMSVALTQTYFFGTDVYERYDLPIISLSVNHEDLYDPETGIYVNFQERDDSWIRAAHAEIFYPDGTSMTNQNIGLSISGVTSATYDVKPFKLNAGKEWDKTTKFINYISPYQSSAISFQPNMQNTDKINSLKLKNGGSGDYFCSLIRDNICMRLAKESGMTPVTDMYPAVVYLNGEYYNVMEVTMTFSPNNLSKIYMLEEDSISVLKDSERAVVTELAGKNYLLNADFTDPSVAADFEETFDKESFFLYYAVEMLIGNTDWPQYNSGAWRYMGESNPDNPYSDGRVRYLFFDASNSYRLESEHEIFDDLFDNPDESKAFLSNVLQNPEYKRYFVNLLCDLLSTTFDTEHILDITDEESSYLETETDYIKNANMGELSTLFAGRDDAVNTLKEKIEERIWYIRTGMSNYLQADYFNEDARYNLHITKPDSGMTIKCNSLAFTANDNDYTGMYYKNWPAMITADVHPGYAFDHWLVNGTEITDTAFLVQPDMIMEGSVTVEAVCHQIEGTSPIISEISCAGSQDWIELYNPYANDIYLGSFFLSDDESRLTGYQLPKITLASGQTLIIYGKNTPELSQYTLNFNLRSGETLFLTDWNGTMLQRLFLPAMTEGTTYGRYAEGNRYAFYTTPSPNLTQD